MLSWSVNYAHLRLFSSIVMIVEMMCHFVPETQITQIITPIYTKLAVNSCWTVLKERRPRPSFDLASFSKLLQLYRNLKRSARLWLTASPKLIGLVAVDATPVAALPLCGANHKSASARLCCGRLYRYLPRKSADPRFLTQDSNE